MIRNRFRTRFISLLAILTTAMTSLIVGATAAAAKVPPEPPEGVSNIVLVPTAPVTRVVTESTVDWWAITLVAIAAAIIAAALTELYNFMQHRRHDHMPLSTT